MRLLRFSLSEFCTENDRITSSEHLRTPRHIFWRDQFHSCSVGAFTQHLKGSVCRMGIRYVMFDLLVAAGDNRALTYVKEMRLALPEKGRSGGGSGTSRRARGDVWLVNERAQKMAGTRCIQTVALLKLQSLCACRLASWSRGKVLWLAGNWGRPCDAALLLVFWVRTYSEQVGTAPVFPGCGWSGAGGWQVLAKKQISIWMLS